MSDGVRTWTKEEALKANQLSSILGMDVHSISEGNIYVETHFPGNSRPCIVMAVKIIEE